MAQFDLDVDDLWNYHASSAQPDDLVEFWRRTIAEARQFDIDVTSDPVDNHLSLIATKDVTFSGFGGQRVRAWLHTPANATGPLPTVIQFHGYSGGRGLPHQGQLYAMAGYAHIVMDVRGQGWSLRSETPDLSPDAGMPNLPGFVTRGVESPQTHYYRRLYTDAVRLLDAAAQLPEVDPDRTVVTGGSQGGATAIAAAALGKHVAGAMIDVPFMSDFRRALQVTDSDPYQEIVRYLARYPEREQTVFGTLAYFDSANLARLASAPALFSVGLLDTIAPPSTVFAAFNAYGGQPRAIEVYAYAGHEGGAEHHDVKKLQWLAATVGPGNAP